MSNQMLNKPFEGLLNREMAIAESKELIEKWSPYLGELVNYATNLYVRSERSLSKTPGTPLSLFMLFYFIIQMADGVQVLCSRCCFDAAIPIIRSLWEGSLSMEWMLKSDFERRSTAYLALFYKGISDFNESLNPATERGKSLQAKRKKYVYHVDVPLLDTPPDNLANQQSQIEKMLERPKFKDILVAFSEGPRTPRKWYSIDGGPMNLEQLADKLERGLEYETLYRHFSALVHGTDVGHALAAHEGKLYHAPMRSAVHYDIVCFSVSSNLIKAIKMMASKFRPDEDTDNKIKEIVRRYRPEAVID
ncbi:MAG: hypothetical protein J7J98_05685 [candidate division Zixibacteria bacterium]|nr:hypothetical protein [candidate division Zixibacteria bacterium]